MKSNGVKQRRVNALARLMTQLETGHKITKDGLEPLTDKDIIRIEKEIVTLKSRI